MRKSPILAAVLLLIASLMAAAGITAVTTTTANAAEDCSYHWSTDYAHENYGFADLSSVDYAVEVYYRNCKAPAAGVSRRVQPLRFDILCRSGGSAGDPEWAHFNLYFFDKDGHSYNPTYKSMPCPDQAQYEQRIYYVQSDAWFHMCDAGAPRWNADLKVKYGNGWGEDTAFLSSTFWGYIGPVNTNC